MSPFSWGDVSVAAFSAGIFAVHPVVVEPVAWVGGREELLMTLGALGCVHFHLSARRLAEQEGRTRAAVACHAGAALCCAAACLSNAVGAVIPLLIAAWDVLMLQRPKLRKILCGTSALWLIGAATIVLKKLGARLGPQIPEFGVITFDRLLVILNVYWLNLKTLVWPTRLAVDYWDVRPDGLAEPEVILGGLALALSVLALWMLRRQRLVLFGLIWFGLALAPTSQLMPHHIDRADRFLYLPLVGLAVAAAMGLRPLGRAAHGRAVRAGLAGAGLLTLLLWGILSAGQVQTWRNSLTMWANCLHVLPNNAYAHGCLADALAEEGRFLEAIPHFETALAIDPNDPQTLNDYAFRLATCRHEELRDYDRAVRLAARACELTQGREARFRRTLATACMNRATALKRQGQPERAIQDYQRAIEADPDDDMPLFNLAWLLATSNDPGLRRPEEAVRLAEKACRLAKKPDAIRLSILAEVYAQSERFDEAAAAAEKGIQLAQAAGNWQMVEALRGRLKLYRDRSRPKTAGD